MIRDDILVNLNKDDILTIFTTKKIFGDGKVYLVGEINNISYCYNPETNKIMDNFYDDFPEIEWFDLSIYLDPTIQSNSKRYFINRNGELIRKTLEYGTVFYLKIIRPTEKDYPYYSINLGTKTFRLLIHRLLAQVFVPTSKDITRDGLQVDHKNRNIGDYSLCNLRWVTPLENSRNTIKIKFVDRYRYEAYLDKDLQILEKVFTDEDIYNSAMSKNYIIKQFRLGEKCYGYYWNVINQDIENYLQEGEEIDDTLWRLHYSGRFLVHPLGIIGLTLKGNPKTKEKLLHTSMTVGYLGSDNYLHFNRCFVHRLVAETFLNGNKPLDPGLVVDHLDTVRRNNRASNLRICTLSENMNNKITINKLCTKVMVEDKVYKSLTDCSKSIGLSKESIRRRINSKNFPEYQYYKD